MRKSRLKVGVPAALTLAFGFGGAAYAQDPAADSPIAERTGPDASQSRPDFAKEIEFARPEVTAPSIAPVSGTVRLSGVEVDASQASPAKVLSNWTPLMDRNSGLSLDYVDDEMLDASWVKRQFAHNGLIGQDVGLDRIVTLIQLINRGFIANGYINSGALIVGSPPESGGVLKIRLISGKLIGGEGKVPGVTVNWGENGRNRLSESYIIARMPAATQTPLNAVAVERQFRLLAENPAIQTVSADLQPGARPGEARLALTVEPQPNIDLYFSAANTRSPSIGSERYAIGGSFRNFLRPGDILSAETGLTGGKQDLIAGYEAPFIGTKTILRARGGFNRAAVIDPQLLPLDITSSDWQAEGGIAHRFVVRPLTPRTDGVGWFSARSLTLGLNVAHRESKTTLLGRPFSFSPGAVNGRSEYTALRLTGDFVERGISTVLAVSLTATQGLNGTKGDVPGLISPDEDFRALRGQVSYARRLNDNGLELRVRVAGQYADGILYSGERFSAGGSQSVRGYRETLVLADTGVSGSLELAQSFSIGGPSADRKLFNWGKFNLAAFADGALLGNREGPSATPSEIASVGVSAAWTPSPAINALVTYGKALMDAPITGGRDLQDRGISFRITIRPLEFFRR